VRLPILRRKAKAERPKIIPIQLAGSGKRQYLSPCIRRFRKDRTGMVGQSDAKKSALACIGTSAGGPEIFRQAHP